MILEFFPPLALLLNEEVSKHPILLRLLTEAEQTSGRLDMETQIGIVAAYCGVMLDGSPLLEEDLQDLFDLLLRRLRNKRIGYIN